MKKVDFKIDRIPPDFPQNEFLTSYLEYLISDLNSKKDCSLENLIEVSSGALKHAFKKIGTIISDQEIFVFKHAISSISRERLEWFNHENKNLKTIFLSRNPFGRLSNILEYNNNYTKRNELNFFKRQINKIRMINNVARDYLRVKKFRNSDNLLIVSFEDLVLDTHGMVQKTLKFLNINKNESKSNQYSLSTHRVKTTPIQNKTYSKFTISKNTLVKWKKN